MWPIRAENKGQTQSQKLKLVFQWQSLFFLLPQIDNRMQLHRVRGHCRENPDPARLDLSNQDLGTAGDDRISVTTQIRAVISNQFRTHRHKLQSQRRFS